MLIDGTYHLAAVKQDQPVRLEQCTRQKYLQYVAYILSLGDGVILVKYKYSVNCVNVHSKHTL